MEDFGYDVFKRMLDQSRQIKQPNKKNQIILKLNFVFVKLGIYIILIGIFLLFLGIVSNQYQHNYYIASGVTGFIGLLFIFSYINYSVTLNDSSIIKRNIIRIRTKIDWMNVSQVYLKNIRKVFIIKSQRKTIKIEVSLDCFYTIIHIIKIKLPQEMIADAIKQLHQYYLKLDIQYNQLNPLE